MAKIDTVKEENFSFVLKDIFTKFFHLFTIIIHEI